MGLAQVGKKALGALLDRRGYLIRWRPPMIGARGMDLPVEFEHLAAHLMLTVPRPYFVGVGANDGVTFDPLYPFIRNHGWRGIAVEPIPEFFAKLRDNYAGFQEVQLVEGALGASDGTATIYVAQGLEQAGSDIQLANASFSKHVLMRSKEWFPDIESKIEERQVPVLSFDTLISRAGNPKVDVIKIDTEGHDLEILRTIDLKRIKPRLVMVEHTSLSPSDCLETAERLLDAGLHVAVGNLDMLGYRQPD